MSSATTPVRVPTDVHQQVTRLAKLCGDQPADLLAAAWREYVERHRSDFAADLEAAAGLVRNGTMEQLISFAQDAHRTVLIVDEEELEAAREDPKVAEAFATAREEGEATRASGRRHEF